MLSLSYIKHTTFMKSQIQAWFKQVWIHSRSIDTHHKLSQSLVLSKILPMSAELQHSESFACHTASATAVFPLLIIFVPLTNTECEVQRMKVTCPKLTQLPSNQNEKSSEI